MNTFHLLANALLIALPFAAGHWVVRKKSWAVVWGVCGVAIGTIGGFLMYRPDLLTRLIPSANLIYFPAAYAVGAAMLLPALLRFTRPTGFVRLRVIGLSALLFGLSLFPYPYFWLPPAESAAHILDENGVCLQTNTSTCSAAAGVTLLSQYDINTTEAEMANLAETRSGAGTRRLGQYRALKIVTARLDRPYDVVVDRLSAEDLLDFNQPAIITVGLSEQETYDPVESQLRDRYGWQPGLLHDVVFLGTDPEDPDKVLIGEPSVGYEKWSHLHLKKLFREYAVYLRPIQT